MTINSVTIGGYAILGSNVISIGLREFMVVFADLRLLQDNGTRNIKEARKLPQEQNRVQHLSSKT